MSDDPALRHALLGWVQDHHIQRYADTTVVSHAEAVDELLQIMTTAVSQQVWSHRHTLAEALDHIAAAPDSYGYQGSPRQFLLGMSAAAELLRSQGVGQS